MMHTFYLPFFHLEFLIERCWSPEKGLNIQIHQMKLYESSNIGNKTQTFRFSLIFK